MTTEQLLSFHQGFCDEAREIVRKKNHDYAGSQGDTPFANFEMTEKLGLSTTGQGILIRVSDKMMRLSTFEKAGVLAVKEESQEDACMDCVNYFILLAAWYRQQRTTMNNQPTALQEKEAYQHD